MSDESLSIEDMALASTINEEPDIFDLMSSVSPQTQEYLDVLNPEQLEAVVHEGSPLLILAGAGSGKTRVITTKIAYLIGERGVDPHQILAVTFTKKAANEMHERAIALEPRSSYAQIRTFHSFGAWFLRLNAEYAGVDPNFTVYDDDDMVTLIGKAVPGLTKGQASHYAHKISLAKDYCYTPDSLKLGEIDTDPQFPTVYDLYQKRLRETGNVDFGDLIMLPYIVLRDNEFIRHRMHDRFRVIMVDEYQDSNVAQYLLLQELSGVNENSGTYVCVVGDDDQSIYKFRGAEIQNILTFKDRFPGTKIVRLEKNYRSTSEILRVADNVVKNNSGRLGKTLNAERGQGKKPVLAFLPNQDEEAQFCSDLIKLSVQNGANYSDWAILYRTNAQSLTFESTFLHRKIPYQVVGSLKFYEREEIKDILAYIALIANPRDEIAFRRIINKPTRGIGGTTQDKIVEHARAQIVLGGEATSEHSSSGDSLKLLSQFSNDPYPTQPHTLIDSCREFSKTASKKAKEGLIAFLEIYEEIKSKLGNSTVPVNKLSELAIGEAPEGVGGYEVTDNEAKSGTSDSATAERSGAGTPEKLPGEKSVKLSELVELIAKKSGLNEYHESQDEVSGTQRVANMQELANSAVPYECTMAGLLEFLDHIELDRTIENPEEENDPNRVTLITLHNTKGLEFNRVVITGMERGIFPRSDKDASEIEEERRLFYVGITRARNELYLTSCSMRRMYGRIDYMEISPFLLEMGKNDVKAIGNQPSLYRRSGFHGGDFGANGLSNPDMSDPIKAKYTKGTKIYHDDYGYGVVVTGVTNEMGEYSISVKFENGGVKKFLPKYQEKALLVVKD